jgi:hypothetical protein
MVLLTQHYDTVTAVGANSKATIMLIPYSPDGMNSVGEQITQALMTTHEAQKPATSPPNPDAPHTRTSASRHT